MVDNWQPVHNLTAHVATNSIHPKNYAHDLCSVVIRFGAIQVSFTHISQGYFHGTGAIMWLPQCQGSDPEEYGWSDLWEAIKRW